MTSKRTRTIAIICGIGEGRWHASILEPPLKAAGFRVINDPAKANIILSHSGGCFFLPKTTPDQTIVLIDPPYWPGKLILVSVIEKIYRDTKDHIARRKFGFWAQKTLWNLIYLFKYVFKSLQMGWFARKQNFYQALAQDTVILIRNEDDVWCTPDIEQLPTDSNPFTYYHLPGQHDDCWLNPEVYAKLLQSKL
jgi:hypothetical protein